MFKRFWWVFLFMAVASPLLGLLISSVITYAMPKKYESTATIHFGAGGFQHGDFAGWAGSARLVGIVAQ